MTFLFLSSFVLSILAPALLLSQETGVPMENEAGHELAARIFRAAGGDRWKTTPSTLLFDFIITRNDSDVARIHHRWVPSRDTYTVSGTTRDGHEWRVDFSSLSRRQGVATLDGAPPPDSLVERIQSLGYGRYINDSYWLMMPVKLLDPGVHHARLADTLIDGATRNVLTIWFDNVGLTPGDRYRIFVDSTTFQVVGWHFQLQGGREGDYIWSDVRSIGPLRLPTVKRSPTGAGIRFEATWEMKDER